ncbi:hypothetical protein SAMN05192549_105176 [Duganella sacchari]|uniref:Uncharacterized protein n=1 Tax=Duganella sacchari TaxID=551987 RepID=A0A1M7PKM7_9BURK|nr:hypothetical protein [Duganella sacchari]SHN17781.1 hypothetical protein SAMN05192549_105176 [Duganella sacchari]
MSHAAHQQVGAAVLQSVLLHEMRAPRDAGWQGRMRGLPIGSPFRGQVPLISPLLFGGK